jgi:SnoaL-like protein
VGDAIEQSDEVRDAMLRFYERVSANDVSSFDLLVSSDPTVLVIGTSHDEWVTERERLRFGFEAEALSIDPGKTPRGFASGHLGWFVDRPVYHFGDLAVATRLTSILTHEANSWKIAHMHVSVGVPDEEVGELQQRWGTAPR